MLCFVNTGSCGDDTESHETKRNLKSRSARNRRSEEELSKVTGMSGI